MFAVLVVFGLIGCALVLLVLVWGLLAVLFALVGVLAAGGLCVCLLILFGCGAS